MVSTRVVLADVPLHQNFYKKSSPCSATLEARSLPPSVLLWQKTAMIFDIPGPHKTGTRAHSQTPPLTKPRPFESSRPFPIPPELQHRGRQIVSDPVSPYGEDSPPKCRGWPSKNTVQHWVSDTPHPKFRG